MASSVPGRLPASGRPTGRETRVVEQLRGQAAARAAAEAAREFHGGRRVSWRRKWRDNDAAPDRSRCRAARSRRGPARPSCARAARAASPGAARPWCAYVPAINKL